MFKMCVGRDNGTLFTKDLNWEVVVENMKGQQKDEWPEMVSNHIIVHLVSLLLLFIYLFMTPIETSILIKMFSFLRYTHFYK